MRSFRQIELLKFLIPENIDPLKIRAFDPWGRIDKDYACLLSSEPLRISKKIG